MPKTCSEKFELDPELKQVWLSMSDLFLDTDIEFLKDSIVKELSQSRFSIPELDQILKEDVAPAVATNLLCVAGVWQGFSEESLIEAILAIKEGRVKKPVFTWLGLKVAKSDWEDVLDQVQKYRSVVH